MPSHRPTKRTRDLVREASKLGLTNAQIACLLPRSGRTAPVRPSVIESAYTRELEEGRAAMTHEVSRSLYGRATGKDGGPVDTSAGKWLLERLGGKQYRPEPAQMELGRAGEFRRMSDEDLGRELGRLEGAATILIDS